MPNNSLKVRILAGLLLVVSLLGFAVPANASADGLVDDYVAAFAPPGLVAATIKGDEVKPILRGRDGAGNPVTSRTKFLVGSLSKSITATAVMLLVDRKRFSLDDPVVKVLPEFRMADPRFTKITVRQVLSHTSGLGISGYDENELPPPGSAQDAVSRLVDKWLVADPGTTYEYRNTNYGIAARLVEVVSGAPFGEFLQREIFTPLGMADSGSIVSCRDTAPGVPSGYLVVLGVALAVPEMPASCEGNGGVFTTLDDMVRWVRFNQGSLRSDLLSPAARAEMYRVQPGTGEAKYGLGVREQPPVKEGAPTFIGHGGTLTTWSSYYVFTPKPGWGAIVLSNASAGAPSLLTSNLVADLVGAPTVPPNNPLNTVNLVVLGLIVIMSGLLIAAIVRAPRWAAKRRQARRPLVVLRLLPLFLITLVGLFLPTVLFGTAPAGSRFNYWVMVAHLMPLVAIFSFACLVLGAIAIIRRLWAWHRSGRAA